MRLTDFAALTFDCYGTLIDWESGIGEALRAWAARRGVEAGLDELLAGFGRLEARWQAVRPALLYPDLLGRVLGDLAAEHGVAASAEERAAFGRSVGDWPAFPDSARALAYLKGYYKLVIVSNVDRASFRRSNAKLGIDFDLVVTAEDVGAYKPDPAPFERALAQLADMGIAKDRVLHTAQSLFHDHVPAKGLGLATMWINRRAGRPGWGVTKAPEAEVKPDFEVPSLAAMAELHRKHLAG